jgi:hypothetical protein
VAGDAIGAGSVVGGRRGGDAAADEGRSANASKPPLIGYLPHVVLYRDQRAMRGG